MNFLDKKEKAALQDRDRLERDRKMCNRIKAIFIGYRVAFL